MNHTDYTHYITKHYYVLRGITPVPCRDMEQWREEFESRHCRVNQTDIGSVYISTVFLGINHAFSFFGDAKPILFETMIFGGKFDDFQDRCSTWAEAEIMHDRAVDMVVSEYQQGFILAGSMMAIAIILAQVFFQN
jgi:hypothetical protein